MVFIIYKLSSVWKNKKIELVGQVDDQCSPIPLQTCTMVQNPTEAHPSVTRNRGTQCAAWLHRSGPTPASCHRCAGPQHPSLPSTNKSNRLVEASPFLAAYPHTEVSHHRPFATG
jgi:hypothetical protein